MVENNFIFQVRQEIFSPHSISTMSVNLCLFFICCTNEG